MRLSRNLPFLKVRESMTLEIKVLKELEQIQHYEDFTTLFNNHFHDVGNLNNLVGCNCVKRLAFSYWNNSLDGIFSPRDNILGS